MAQMSWCCSARSLGERRLERVDLVPRRGDAGRLAQVEEREPCGDDDHHEQWPHVDSCGHAAGRTTPDARGARTAAGAEAAVGCDAPETRGSSRGVPR